jgi:HK97 gp10 family phage protein
LQKKAQKNADFKGHYEGKKFVKPTGHLKRSIGLEISANGLTATVEPTADYAAYVEYGTRFMDAQPYLKPAYTEQLAKFKSDLSKLVK